MNALKYIFLISIASIISACSSQRYVNSETDDLYFTPNERFEQDNNSFSTVSEVDGSDYVSESEYQGSSQGSDYFVKGKAAKSNDANPNAASKYDSEQENQTYYSEEESEQQGTTVNHFYGSTNYYEDDGYDDTYATRIRRFSNVNVSMGYGYYDPYFVDPYWNYGWSYWNPYPRTGWSVGWSSYYGWNVGYNYGWAPYWGGTWGYGNYWGRPWGYGYNGYCGVWGNPYAYGGYNSYWNGYNNGYSDGWYDGSWSNNGSNSASRGVYNGRRSLATDRGITGTGGSPGSGNDGRTNNRLTGGNNNPVGVADHVVRDSPKPKTQPQFTRDKLAENGSKIYQAPNRQIAEHNVSNKGFDRQRDINPRATSAAGKDYKSTEVRNTRAVVDGRSKYESQNLSRAPKTENRYDMNRPTSPANRTAPQRTRTNVAPKPAERPSRNYSTPKDQTPASPRYYRPEQRENRPTNRGRNDSYYAPKSSPSNSTRTRPNSSVSPTRSTPSPSRTRTSSPTRSTPTRTSPTRSGGSSNRSFSAPSRSSSPSRSVSPSPSSRSASPRSHSPSSGGRRR